MERVIAMRTLKWFPPESIPMGIWVGILLCIAFMCSLVFSDNSDGRPAGFEEQCIRGVTYYHDGYSGLAPAYLINGELIACDGG